MIIDKETLRYEVKEFLRDTYDELEFLDSLDVIESSMMMEEEYDVEIPDALVEQFMGYRSEVKFDDVLEFLITQIQSQLNM